MASNNAPIGKPVPGSPPRTKGARVISDEARAFIIELIVEGQDDYGINHNLISEGYIVPGEAITYRQMRRYRNLDEARPKIKHMNLRAQQLGSAAYSEVVINTILLGRAAIKALLTVDKKDGQSAMVFVDESVVVARNADGDEKYLTFDARMIKALSDNHYKSADIVLKLFTPDAQAATDEENGVDTRMLAMADLAEQLAGQLAARRLLKNIRAAAQPGEQEDTPEAVGSRTDYMEIGE